MSPTTDSGPPPRPPLESLLEWFWHPVATVAELSRSGGVMPARLLDRDLVVALLAPDQAAVMLDRCPHRSTRLSLGTVDGSAIRCAYHGWRWDRSGRCVEVPSAPGLPVPARFTQQAFDATVRYGLVWACLRSDTPARVPPVPAAEDPCMRIVAGEPYLWPTGACRRVENFVDLAHFAWVHDGTLGTRSAPVPPEVEVRRCGPELRFDYEPPPMDQVGETALVGTSVYRMPMPLTVDIAFTLPGRPHSRRHLWMTAAPVGSGACRTYWSVARNDDLDRPDAEYLDFQRIVLEEDRPVVCNQVPPEIPLELGDELTVGADRVSLEYRRWLRELLAAAARGPDTLAECLGLGVGLRS